VGIPRRYALGNAIQLLRDPASLGLVHGNPAQDEIILLRIVRGAGVIQVKEMHEKKKAAGRTNVQRTESAALPTAGSISLGNKASVKKFDEFECLSASEDPYPSAPSMRASRTAVKSPKPTEDVLPSCAK
jgi:hypothetical protein